MIIDIGVYQLIVGIIAIIIPIVLFTITTMYNKKRLGFFVYDSYPVISNNFKSDSLKVFHNGSIIENAYITSIFFQNSGKKFIGSQDFIESIKIKFEKSSKIFDVMISSKSPESLTPIYQIKGDEVEIEPLDFNVGDFFYVNILSQSELLTPKITSQLKGAREIFNLNKKYVRVPVKYYYLWWDFSIALLFQSAVFWLIYLIFS